MVKHTPGPWMIGAVAPLGTIVIKQSRPPGRADEDAALLASVVELDVGHAEARANALLIAAAPDLISALTRLLIGSNVKCRCTVAEIESGHHVDCWRPQIEEAQNLAIDAIRKAHGG